ncbi:hypothetical protein BpHYR1_053590 [Brachionus plicatilis]|uniref:Uncharacterized protein n=1 Tax=Brachionus plicatilis TaxID=10195 RepID=A0A3M7QUJ5_BRAPC|nr:hypothetical protein BpHYR1_053590 [Brachionus plicatilis]
MGIFEFMTNMLLITQKATNFKKISKVRFFGDKKITIIENIRDNYSSFFFTTAKLHLVSLHRSPVRQCFQVLYSEEQDKSDLKKFCAQPRPFLHRVD